MSKPSTLREEARWYYGQGFNVLAIAAGQKRPLHKYTDAPHDYKTRRQTAEEVEALPWERAGRVGLVCGLGHYCVDFDTEKDKDGNPTGEPVDFEAVTLLLESLGVGQSYPWVYTSSSGVGFHVWVACSEDLSKHGIEAGAVHFEPRDGVPHFHHAELRWHDCIAVAGDHTEGKWLHGRPSTPPAVVSAEVLLHAMEAIGTRKGAERVEVKQEPEAVTTSTTGTAETTSTTTAGKTKHGSFVEVGSGEVVGFEEKKQHEEDVKQQIRERFDLVGYLCRQLGVTRSDVHDAGKEWRVGSPGAGLGGWHVTKDGQVWNTFRDGSGNLGGDCFEAVGFFLYGEGYDKRNSTKWRKVLEEAAREAGVELPVYTRTARSDYGHVSTDTADRKASKSSRTTTAEDVQEFLSERFKLRWNNVRLRVEWTLHEEEQWRPITDNHEASWRVSYEKQSGKRAGREAFSDYVRDLAYSNKHEPFVEYFDSLPKYNEAEGDRISAYANLVKTTSQALFVEHFHKWVVATYACAYYDAKSHGFKNRNEHFLVLSGRQGIGKTTFLRALVPNPLQGYTLEKRVKDCKDSEQELAQAFLLQDDELRTLGGHEAEAVKALLSQASFLFRPPYGRHPEEFSRRVSFCGSTNAREFLRDPTGSRRFMVHEALAFDLEAIATFDVSRMWAQARHLYEQGFRFYHTPEEQAELEAHNVGFSASSLEEDLVKRYFEPVEWGATGADYKNTTELCVRIAELFDKEHTIEEPDGFGGSRKVRDGVPRFKHDSVATQRNVGAALDRLGYVCKSKRGANSVPTKKWCFREKQRAEWASDSGRPAW